MTDKIEVTGMVLTAMPIGDYDKRITILTTDRGKITAFARGARRPKSSLIAATNPFTFGSFELVEGKNAYSLIKSEIKNSFRDLTSNMEKACVGFYFLEFAEYSCRENNDEKEILKLLYQSLRALESEHFSPELVRAVFELKAITINGEGPQVFSCMQCGGKENLNLFSVERGGCFCEECAAGKHAHRIFDSTRYAMQFIEYTPVKDLFSFALSGEVLSELKAIMNSYMKHYVHHRFKSLDILESVQT